MGSESKLLEFAVILGGIGTFVLFLTLVAMLLFLRAFDIWYKQKINSIIQNSKSIEELEAEVDKKLELEESK